MEGVVIKINVSTGTSWGEYGGSDCEIVTPMAEYVYEQKTYFMNVIWPADPNDYSIGKKVMIAFPKDNPANPIHFTPKRWLKEFYEGFFGGLVMIASGIFFVMA